MFGRISPTEVAAQLIVLFFAIGIHEYAHCKFADLAGDPTPRYYGRVTLNLFKHFEPTGTILMIFTVLAGFGIGWGKPSPVDPRKMKNPRWDWFISVAAGPVSNFIQAVIYAILYRLEMQMRFIEAIGDQSIAQFLFFWIFFGVLINIGLFLFNLIPFGPLDGHWLVGLLLPEKVRVEWFRFNRTVGMPGLIVLVLASQWFGVNPLVKPAMYVFHILAGPLPVPQS
jgi:Zn-dependent protease